MASPKKLDALAAFLLFIAGAWIAHVKQVGPRPWDSSGPIGRIASDLYDWPIAVYLAVLAGAAFVKIVSVYIKNRRTKDAVYRLLDAMVAEVMRTPAAFNTQDYRVTLFKYKRFSAKAFFRQCSLAELANFSELHFIGWLVPYARSGDDKVGGTTCFVAPPVSVQGQTNGQGACGTAWLLGECHVSHLPKLTSSSGEAQRKKYANKSHISLGLVNTRISQSKSLALSYAAERLATSFNPRWGVVVYDSVEKESIIDTTNEKAHRVALQALSLVLEEYAS